jgi:serine/threonine protein phosphatase 1
MNYLKTFQENKLGKDYVVGDIHGCFSKLREVMEEIEFDSTKDRLFSVGDLVDRGPESEEALDWLAKTWFHAVRGNHEQMTIDLQVFGPDIYSRHNGMGWILDLPKEHQQLFADAFKELPIAIEIVVGDKKYGIIHAEVPTKDWNDLGNILNGKNSEGAHNVAMWSRDRINGEDKGLVDNVELVYVGHTPLKEVTVLGNILYIDTAACFRGGHLTVLEIY